MLLRILYSLILSSFFYCKSYSQNIEKPVFKFGDIKASDFSPKIYNIDSNANAIVLADIGSSKFEGNNNGNFSIVYKRFTRIKIINKNGFDHSSFQIIVYHKNNIEEKLDNLEGTTYNLEGTNVVSTKLEKTSVFKSEPFRNYSSVKFTLPNVKEGSIIECSYTIKTPFYEYLRDWNFQRDIPVLWSQYDVAVPALFDYVLLEQGPLKYTINESKVTRENYTIIDRNGASSSEMTKLSGDLLLHSWAIKNIPALKNESFISNIENYSQLIEFQMRSIHLPDGNTEDRMGSWPTFARALISDENFGRDLEKDDLFSSDFTNSIGKGDGMEKAVKIFQFVRDNFNCVDHNSFLMDDPLKKIYKNKKGNVAEINLLLTGLFNRNGYEAHPVILSTKEHGRMNEEFPIRSKFNYVICRVKIEDQYYLLDASDKLLPFATLPENIYNGSGRLIADPCLIIQLSADSVKENKLTSVFIYNNENSKGMNGTFKSQYGTYESVNLRKTINKNGKDLFYQKLKKLSGPSFNIKDQAIDSLQDIEKPVALNYSFDYNNEGDVLYFNPMLTEIINENPFKSEQRLYPVEMPYTIKKTYLLTMEIPKGYQIEELPKSEMVKLNDNEGYFEYLINKSDEEIQLRVKLVTGKANFNSEDYKTIRDFYAFMVKKESEMFVFKKIK